MWFTPLFLQLRLFRLFRVLIADSCEISEVMGERVKLRAMWITEDSKGSSKWPNIGKFRGPNRSTKEAKMQSSRSGGPGGTEPTTVCPWRTPRTVVGGDARLCPRHARPCAPATWFFFVFRSTFRLPAVFPATFPYISDAPGHYKTPNTLPFCILSSS